MRNSIVRAYALGIITGSFLTAGLVFGLAPAKASPEDGNPSPAIVKYILANERAMCNTLAAHPSVSGVEGVLLAIEADGLTPMEAGQALAYGVADRCPEYTYLLTAFINKWGGKAA